MSLRTHHMEPTKKSVRVVFAYKNFAAVKGISHIGLGVAALNTVRVLRKNGYWAEVWPILSVDDLKKKLAESRHDAHDHGQVRVSHVVISAPWISGAEMALLTHTNPEIVFSVIVHSNVGFLQADPRAFTIIRDGINLAQSTHNFNVGGNCKKFTEWVERTYNCECLYMPNLYDDGTFCKNIVGRKFHKGDTLRIGCFGATRILKNILTGGAAALQIANQLGMALEFWISRGRDGSEAMMKPLQEMYAGHRNAIIKENWWQSWPEFTRTIGHMHLLIQPSFTESFNMVTADGLAQGVPSVVSTAIDWAPERWIGNSDDAGDLAKVGLYLLSDDYAIEDGRTALTNYVTLGLEEYKRYFARRR